jgi:alpha-amylase
LGIDVGKGNRCVSVSCGGWQVINICIYFQVHQPFRLRQDYSFFDIGKNHDYEDRELNANIVRKVAGKCY